MEYSKNKFACELLDGLIHDDRYKAEDGIIFFEDQIYFVPQSTLEKRLVRTTHSKPAEVTRKSYPQYKDCTNMEQSRLKTNDKGHKETHIATENSPKVHDNPIKGKSTRLISC